jgi:signal transduction histidine kinase
VGDEKLLLWFAQETFGPGQLEQMRRDLAAMTYHDLRGPLHNIHGSLGRMGKILNGSQPPVVVDLLQIAERSAGQMGRMIDTLLDIDRLEEGRTILNRRPVSLNALLAEAVESVRPLLQENDQEFHFRIEDDLPMLKLDADMIMRVITNLVENAAKYTPDGGLIILSAQMSNEGVCINVSDSGPGVPDHVKDQIFDKYVRIRRSDAPKGVGLGLAFCRLAVEAHGGRIWVDSGADEGAVFCFVLPMIAQPTPPVNDPVEARQA